MTTEIRALYTRLPAIDRLLRDPAFSSLLAQHGHSQVVTQLRQMLDEAREQIRQCQTLPDWSHDWLHACEQRLTAGQRSALRPVFNLTGTVLHTNLGRAIRAESAVEAVASAMRAPVTLEYDLDDAGRGHRDRAIADLLCQITGAEDACIVNNNAAAVLLMLAATASGREVVVSRGELVEIGGAFRIPDVMRQAGCQLHEVGTTNRTHAKDYRQAVNDNTALLMKVHTSNYSIEGFTKAVDEAELAAIGRELDVPVVADPQRVAGGSQSVWPAKGADAAGDDRRRGEPGQFLRRQAARWPAGRDYRRQTRADCPAAKPPAEAGPARR